MKRHRNLLILGVVILLSAATASVLLVSAPGPEFTAQDKAFYADSNLINFVRPGLDIKIQSATIATDGTIQVRFKLSDPRGLPLDRDGVTTPGTVATSFIAATIPSGQKQYTSYTTRTQTSPITSVTATQAASDAGGVYEKIADGDYRYTFRTKAPANMDRNATHTIGVYGSRNLTEFDLGTNFDDDTFNFVPAGGTVTVTRDVIKTATCNKCHDQLAFHGGSRRSMELCVLCHTPQTTDPDTGNTVDMVVMTHRIHMGKELPSVKAGKPYQIIGFNQSVADYSEVGFPANTRNCDFCHEAGPGPRPPAQQTAWLTNPNRAACGSCHDDVNFATGEGHVNLPQVSDSQCNTCHTPQGELDFDASIKGAHVIPERSASLQNTVFELLRVTDGVAGKTPTVTFTVKDKTGKPIPPASMARLALVMSGPTADYASYVTEDVRRAQGTPDGVYFWTFASPIPAGAKGSFSIGIEGYTNQTLLAGTKKEMTLRDAGVNKVITFSVDGTPIAQRRQVVTTAKCNGCHSFLSLHGSNRNQIEMCVLCHDPNENDSARRPAAQNPPETVDFRTMIHKIHTGKDLETDFTIFGFGGSRNNFNKVGFPAFSPTGTVGDRRNCSLCHVNGSEQLPLRANLLPVKDQRGRINPVGPATAACISCHTSLSAASHALVNTTTLGESCDVCHGRNSEFSVSKAHAR